MSVKKTIQINPELFKIPGNKKNKKNKTNKTTNNKMIINSIVSPSNLKTKL